MDASKLLWLDAFAKSFQILFFIVAGVCTVLTYRSLKRGWLNSVNTEYQKKVIERLSKVAEELNSEFDLNSDAIWFKNNVIPELIERENAKYLLSPQQYKERPPAGRPITKSEHRMSVLLQSYRTDPFIPVHIRGLLVDLLAKRETVSSGVYMDVITQYRAWLVQAPIQSSADLDQNWGGWHNIANDMLYERGCGISAIEAEVNNIRLAIQQYFEGFSPVKPPRVKKPRKPRQFRIPHLTKRRATQLPNEQSPKEQLAGDDQAESHAPTDIAAGSKTFQSFTTSEQEEAHTHVQLRR